MTFIAGQSFDLKSLLSCIAKHTMNSTLSSLIIAGIHLQSKNVTFRRKKKQFISDHTHRYRRKFRAVLKIGFVNTNEQTRSYINTCVEETAAF